MLCFQSPRDVSAVGTASTRSAPCATTRWGASATHAKVVAADSGTPTEPSAPRDRGGAQEGGTDAAKKEAAAEKKLPAAEKRLAAARRT